MYEKLKVPIANNVTVWKKDLPDSQDAESGAYLDLVYRGQYEEQSHSMPSMVVRSSVYQKILSYQGQQGNRDELEMLQP